MKKVGIIGGSGLESISSLTLVDEIKVETQYGKPSSSYRVFRGSSVEFYQLNRHGDRHSIAPHNINYRANISGFKQLDVGHILTFSAVGAISTLLKVNDMVLTSNAIDFTHGRVNTFFDKGDDVYHVDFSNPFCNELRTSVKHAAITSGIDLRDLGVYVCTNGPRFETAAEINMYRMMGADIVGMTMFPEATLAREAQICYANVSVVTNLAPGITPDKLTSDEVVKNAKKVTFNIADIIVNLQRFINEERVCECSRALNGAKINK